MKAYKLFAFPLTIILLSSCSTLSSVMDSSLSLVGLGPENRLSKITVESAADSNSQNPVAIDVAFIFDDAIAKSVTNLTAPQWFQRKNALVLQNPKKLNVISTDLVPATPAMSVTFPENSKDAVAVLFFANYLSEKGQLAAGLEGFEHVSIKLNQHQYDIETGDK